jgi:hypothetical protein
MKYAVEMASDGMLHLHEDQFRHSKALKGDTHTDIQTDSEVNS